MCTFLISKSQCLQAEKLFLYIHYSLVWQKIPRFRSLYYKTVKDSL
jgi:hypothetical protein